MGCNSEQRHGSVRDDEFDPGIEVWMKSHSVDDLDVLAVNKKARESASTG
jgi:hypothetical protein